ncbi:Formate hydrogenlyase subunit 3/Multisubunit Na+/H+ antiporter, MnhD subunit [Methylocella tundrae]|uniref:Formate hydrogenlyase subunit 3/Multisubunit Na+/H+ antiporter, MnhD subunit n=1 Tax=Methylocella tundrae TaxID=227605 RepID=A0A8B6M810_METTU|nr:proton-conducting transporter membrane subunit [Methylocella tundrae]VTZ23416.1 Formate hydrogenlyase subunit 3/Multisubunit Na+/H+ antiporter, MnhD subunit [Methylocella tundrae]VTZ50898.1 Formate hydrogenlyase subunit 3/Multisubunit Na+/H+ antiporter, MnhD subunit [Methylocella tundrae]
MIHATTGGFLLVLAIVLPVAGVLLSFLLGGRNAERIALALMPFSLGVASAIAFAVFRAQRPIVYVLGGWSPPLGIALRADGFSAVMLVTAALVIAAAGLFARANFRTPEDVPEARAPLAFWTLLQALLAALNIVFVGGDLFNLYVALELLTFAAVPLVCLDGRPETLVAALRYLLFALFGSVLYLLGVALLYGAYGTLDIVLLSGRIQSEPAVWVAAGLMTAGLLAKTALFPLHLWLPPAHANAPAAASAVLSALVVKASFFLIVRLWFDVLPAIPNETAMAILASLGSAAILFGSVLALRQARLKLLVAYSTVAQIGYLFLMFPLAAGSAHPWAAVAWSGGLMQTLSHAFAKAAMFLAAGLVAECLGHDRIKELGGLGRAMPMTVFAFGLGGLSLMGLPPSGGFAAKWLLLKASVEAGQWIWAVVILAGGLLAGGYIYRALAPALANGSPLLKARPRRGREAIALALAVVGALLGFAPPAFFELLQIGRLPLGGLP